MALAMISRHKMALIANRKPGEGPSQEESRWALLVTFEELDGIVNEIQTINEGPVSAMDEAYAAHVKEGRAMLHLDGVPILPELIIKEGEKLDG
jgi:hypothetical protein